MTAMDESKKIEALKQMYNSIEIPPELATVVAEALNNNSPVHQEEKEYKGVIDMNEKKAKNYNHKKIYRTLGTVAAGMAICVGVFAYGVTSSEAFATSMRGVPLLGSLVQVFTGESVNNADKVSTVKMALPKVDGLTDQAVEDRINKEIEQKMTAIVKESKARMAEDKKAYLETGGTEAEYKERIPEIVVDYEVKSVSDHYLSFLVTKTETSASAYFEQYYYNIDLKTNKDVTLTDLLGKDYLTKANKQITDQITERAKDENAIYWGFGTEEQMAEDQSMNAEKFTTISDTQNFYINEDEKPVIVFNKYEIAPGYMGIQEFVITK